MGGRHRGPKEGGCAAVGLPPGLTKTQGVALKRINLSGVSAGIAVTSLFIALGGPAQAASLFSGQNIKNNSVTGIDVKNNSLTGLDVKNLRRGDFAAGQIPAGERGLTGAAGAAGAAGATGEKGDKGDVGPAGPSRWVLVNRDGAIEAQSGGFRIANAYPAGGAGEGNVYIDSGDANLSNNGIVATIALENQYSLKGATPSGGTLTNGRNPEPDNNPEFSGEISATKCAIGTGPNAVTGVTGVVACAPLDTTANGGDNLTTNRDRYFVVSPRLSDGGFTRNDTAPGAGDNTHKRFYVIISGPRD